MRALAVLAALGCAALLGACTRTYVERPVVERPVPAGAPIARSAPGATVVTPPAGGGSTVVVNPNPSY